MPAPTSHTETSLKQFVVDELGAVGVSLGLTTSSAQVAQTVYAVERLLGVSDVATVTDMPKLEALTRWLAWRAAKAAGVGKFDAKAGSTSATLSQIWDHLAAMLCEAERAAMRYPEAAAMLDGSVPVPYAGGLSRSDKALRAGDRDRVRPLFTRDLHEPVGVGCETE
jgi:hypothetical protein